MARAVEEAIAAHGLAKGQWKEKKGRLKVGWWVRLCRYVIYVLHPPPPTHRERIIYIHKKKLHTHPHPPTFRPASASCPTRIPPCAKGSRRWPRRGRGGSED